MIRVNIGEVMKKVTATFIILMLALSGGGETYADNSEQSVAQTTTKKTSFKDKFNAWRQNIKNKRDASAQAQEQDASQTTDGKPSFKDKFNAWKQNTKNKFNYKVLKKSSDLQNEFMKNGSVDIVALNGRINKTINGIITDLKAKEISFTEKGFKGQYKFVNDTLVKLCKVSEKLLTALKKGQYKKILDLEVDITELLGRSYGCLDFMNILDEGYIRNNRNAFTDFTNSFSQLADQMLGYNHINSSGFCGVLILMKEIYAQFAQEIPDAL